MKASELKDRTRRFSVRVISLMRLLPKSAIASAIVKPLAKCGTAVGFSYHKLCRSHSPYDFKTRLEKLEVEADDCCYWLTVLRDVDDTWAVASGLSSGEGLINNVRDAREETNPKTGKTEVVDAGVADKRLLVVETEWATVLTRIARDGNSLSAVVRDAWDHGNLSTLTKHDPLKATGAHVSIIGHVTPDCCISRL